MQGTPPCPCLQAGLPCCCCQTRRRRQALDDCGCPAAVQDAAFHIQMVLQHKASMPALFPRSQHCTLLDVLDTRPLSGLRSTIFLTWQPGWLHL